MGRLPYHSFLLLQLLSNPFDLPCFRFLSVVGGYLAYIGWFCGRAGIDLMMSAVPNRMAETNDTGDDHMITARWIVYVLPGVLGGAMIYLAIRKVHHMATLPICVLLEFILFYIVLHVTNTSVEDATILGWIRSATVSSSSSNIASSQSLMWYQTWDYIIRFDLIDWNVLPMLWPNLLGMIFVVALSSSLDVAAIEIELKQPLNYNHELQMIGMSNMISGCTGGYTGSYIFSQSIFSLRAGIRSRWSGFVLAFCELLIFITPIPILSYVPNFLFGSLLFMICIDLMLEWLWHVRHRFTAAEYMLCLSTFGLIQWMNVEYGILMGIVLYLLLQQTGLNVGVSKFVSSTTEMENETIDDVSADGGIIDKTCIGLHRQLGSTAITASVSYGSV
jgi:SulP family sulfate permease